MKASSLHEFPSMNVTPGLLESSLGPKLRDALIEARISRDMPVPPLSDIRIDMQQRYQLLVLLADYGMPSIRTFMLDARERMLTMLLPLRKHDARRSLAVPLEESELGLIRDLEYRLPLSPEEPARTLIGGIARKVRNLYRRVADCCIPDSLRDRRYVNMMKKDFGTYIERNKDCISLGLSHDADVIGLLREFLHARGISDEEAFQYLAEDYISHLA